MDTKNNNRFGRIVLPALLFLLCLAPLSGAESADTYSAEELDEIVAPIALYPDVVISSMLPASSAPTDVVQAARWVADQDGEISEVPEDSGWDPAVEALVQFPDVLTWMSENLDWMEMLGYAVAVQQEDVLTAIQDFRAKVDDAGNLESDDHIQVVKEEGDVITIQPAQPQVVYVPTYDPVAVVRPGYSWGAWGAGFAMGALGAWAWHGIGWGHNGHGGSINVNNSRNFNFNNNGNINTGNIGSGNRWNSGNRPSQRPNTRPNQRPKRPNYNQPGRARPGKGGVKPGNARPGKRPGSRPGSRPGDRPGSRPGSKPGSKPGGNRPGSRPGSKPGSKPGGSRPGARPGGKPGGDRPGSRPGGKPGGKPSTRPSKPPSRPQASKGSRSSMSGSSRNGRSTRQASSRGNKSLSGGSKSRGSSSRSRSGGSRSGGSRGGSRGGGGRRR